MKQLMWISYLTVALMIGGSLAVTAATPKDSLKTIRSVGAEGQGNLEASAAWQELVKSDARSMVDILEAMDGSNPLALNWLRSAIDTIAARELAAGRKLPVASLEKFLLQRNHHPRSRRLAYELIAQAEPSRAEALLGKMLDDPSTELRRDAIERVITEARGLRESKKTNDAIARYRVALQGARDVDQIESVAKSLKELGKPVQLTDVFGWVADWKVIGPFDSSGGAGFDKVFPPEEKLDLLGEYDGKAGKVRWQPLRITNDFGLIDFNKPLGSLKGVAGYAYTEINSKTDRPVEIRLGCKNAWKIWLNGQLLFGRDEYHRGMEIDQYRLKAGLKPGKNALLVKLCQNEQKEEWTKEWEFQLRITDALGTPIDFAQR